MEMEKLLERLRRIIELIKAGEWTSMEMVACWLYVAYWSIEWARNQASPSPLVFGATSVDREVLESMAELRNLISPDEQMMAMPKAGTISGVAANWIIKMFLIAAINRLLEEFGNNLPDWAREIVKRVKEAIEKL